MSDLKILSSSSKQTQSTRLNPLSDLAHLREIADIYIITPERVIVINNLTSEPNVYSPGQFQAMPGSARIENVAKTIKMSDKSSKLLELIKKCVPDVSKVYVKPH